MRRTSRQKLKQARAERKRRRLIETTAAAAASTQVAGKKDESEKQASTKPAKKEPKRKSSRKRSGYMEFFFESVYQVVTWVCIALSIGFFILFYSQHNWKGVLWAGCALLCSTIIMLTLLAQRYFPAFSGPLETEFHGFLVPANEPTPANPCNRPDSPVPADAVTLLLGKGLGVWTTQFPMVAIRVHGVDFITIKKTTDGLAISTRVFSGDGRVVAEVEDNEFHVNPNNYFKIDRPNRSTLRVFDQTGRVVLGVRYLNPQTIKVSGVFYPPNFQPIVIDDETVHLSPFQNSTMCMGNGRIGVLIP